MLLATGVQPYLLRHGSERDAYHLVLLRLNEADGKALDDALGAPATRVKVGPVQFVALPLEPGAKIGAVDAKYYNAEKQSWTASLATSPYR